MFLFFFSNAQINRRTGVLAAARRSPPHICGDRRQSEFRCSSPSARLIWFRSSWRKPSKRHRESPKWRGGTQLLRSASLHLCLDACSWSCAARLLQQWDCVGVSQWKASGAAPPTGTQLSSYIFKVFGFLNADLAELFDFTEGDSWVERSPGAEVLNKITENCLFCFFVFKLDPRSWSSCWALPLGVSLVTCSFTFCLKPGQTLVLQVCRCYQITSIVLIISISLLDNKENPRFQWKWVILRRWIIVICFNNLWISSCCSLSCFFFFPGGDQNHYMTQGLWVILGLLVFLLLEKMFPDQDAQEGTTSHSDLNFNCAVSKVTRLLFFPLCLITLWLFVSHTRVVLSLWSHVLTSDLPHCSSHSAQTSDISTRHIVLLS